MRAGLSRTASGRAPPGAGGGKDLKVSLDVNIQAYCQQAAEKAMAEKQADSVSILLMNPQNAEKSMPVSMCRSSTSTIRSRCSRIQRTFGKRNSGSAEPDVAECLHQRYVRAGIYL